MKMHQKIRFLFIVFILLTLNTLRGQDTIPADPLFRFKYFGEFGVSLNAMRVNTNYTTFMTTKGRHDFIKNNYLASLDMHINFGILDKGTTTGYSTSYKTGIHVLSRLADLKDNTGKEVRLTTGYLQVPVQLGVRFPLNYNTIKNNLYRAVELHTGLYAAIPLMQKLDHRDNIDSRIDFLEVNYVKFGAISELVFAALNTKGHGHKFGIRASFDFVNLYKFKETKDELYPFYTNIGVFYNIMNTYF